jgi:23S rRNA (cytidine1920-2'-O)/16S rRNA (cytidine1409-2'-O)-methyltransferase
MTRRRARLRRLASLVERRYPELADPRAAVAAGLVTVDGKVAANPDSWVRLDAHIALGASGRPLRGEAKLRAAIAAFSVSVEGRVALDLGASAGGFTRVLLQAGAARVYAVDAGHGQLLGSLRQDPRVVNLERTNLSALDRALVPDTVELITIDLSYLAVAGAVGQLAQLAIAADADLIALVKPMFELSLPRPPDRPAEAARARSAARRGIEAAGWSVQRECRSPVLGRRGAVEFLVHARRRASAPPCPARSSPGRR